MPSRSADRFPCVLTEGSILPADLLLRISAGDSHLQGLTPAAYHLLEGEKLNEATNRAWNRLLGVWTSFQKAVEKLPEKNGGTSVTRDRWLLPLWHELGYGRLTTAAPVEIDGKAYPISHGWQHTPIHLVGCRVDLDRRIAERGGTSLPSPHSLVQELINRSERHLWAFVTNGLRLRILRDNNRLTRQAYVEFDLQAMFEGKVYTDFALLWRLCHQSRVEAEKPHECWLEQWSKAAQQQGLRVLDQLRGDENGGVVKAIAVLGRGFLACPANHALRGKLRAGNLDSQDYYRQLLRLVYRLLFLFVAEDRELLFDPKSDEASRDRYTRFYSTTRLRSLAERLRGTQHTDLYQMLTLVMARLGSPTGCPELGLPALGGFLFSSDAIPDLDGCQLANVDLLETIRALAVTSDGHALRQVDYRNLGSEELGSVYESLLELHPVLNAEAATFELKTASGHERKTTGSYYTPTSLITCLLDSALDPVLDEAVKQPDPEAALRNLKVCDPACGSGHFLIAAAHRIAKRLAAVRTGDEEPAPEALRHALRDVIGHCIYGVDINPMAVELCKVALWMEALEPGKPLSFLDHHIQCGNSLLGTTPALLAGGIPDAAFTAIEGDVKSRVADLKKDNKRERQDYAAGQSYLFEPFIKLGSLAADFAKLNAAPDGTPADVAAIQDRYAELVRGSGYQFGRLLADTWCAAFVWKKDDTDLGKLCPTERDFRKVETHAAAGLLPHIRAEVERLRDQYQFFHWHLAFPDVFRLPRKDETPENEQAGWSGGFDVVLGNPPWERIKLQEKEWFAERRPDIAMAPNIAARKRLIDALRTADPTFFTQFQEAVRQSDGESHLLRDTCLYPLCGRGDINVYAVFAESMRSHVGTTGRVGCILPSGIATDDTTKFFFQDLIEKQSLVSLFDFENRERTLFPDIYYRMRFCLITYGSGLLPTEAEPEFVFLAHRVEDLDDSDRRFSLTRETIALLNPNTRTCPIFRNQRDLMLCQQIRHDCPPWKLISSSGDVAPWGHSIRRVIDTNTQAELLRSEEDLDSGTASDGVGNRRNEAAVFVRLFEGKMIEMFHHRFADSYTVESAQRSGRSTELATSELTTPQRFVRARYWVDESEVASRVPEWKARWFLSYMDICSITNERTVIAAIIPWSAPSFSLRVLASILADDVAVSCLLANLSAFVFDYYTRQFVSGLHLSDYIMLQMPVLPPDTYSNPCPWSGNLRSEISHQQFILPRVLELTYTAWDLEPFARDCGYAGPPFRWDEARRFLLRAELDAAFFHLYGITALDAAYILDTFPIVRRKDEQKYNGEYKTKTVILEIYEAMAEASRTGQPYQTRLNPPPADPRVAHPPRDET